MPVRGAHFAMSAAVSPTPRGLHPPTRATSPRLRAILCALALLWGLLASPGHAAPCPQAPPWPAQASAQLADLFWQQAWQQRAQLAAIEPVLRLEQLRADLPETALDPRWCALARSPQTHPLLAAEADRLRLGLALRRLDLPTAEATTRRLGLLSAFVWRDGEAPHPLAPLDEAEGWRPLPPHAAQGERWLEAWVRPVQNGLATLATRLDHPQGGPAVLRFGHKGAATIWLNGERILRTEPQARAAFDQYAVPVQLAPGPNRLVFELHHDVGAWRLWARLTDTSGRPLPHLDATAAPWGPCPEAAEASEALDALTGRPHSPHDQLRAEAERDDASAQSLRAYAEYARHVALPEPDLSLPLVLAEQAFHLDPSPESLATWLALLPEEEAEAQRGAHAPARPFDHRQQLIWRHLRLADAQRHFFARRPLQTRRQLEALRAEPSLLPAAERLWSQFLQDLGLSHRAVAELDRLDPALAQSIGLTQLSALRAAGRHTEALATLRARVERGPGDIEDRLHLASLLSGQGAVSEAVEIYRALAQARPELHSFLLEAADLLRNTGDLDAAQRLLDELAERLPEDASVAHRLALIATARHDLPLAREWLQRALRVRPDDEDLRAELRRLEGDQAAHDPPPPLGPPIEALTDVADPPQAAAHVLLHHAQVHIEEDGRATRRVRRVVRILSEEGARRFALWSLSYVPSTQRLTVHTAHRLRPGEAPARPRRSEQDLSEPEARLYYDLRAELLRFDRLRPGDLLEVSWSLTDQGEDPAFPGYFGDLAWLQETSPRARSVVELTGPGAARLRATLSAQSLDVRREGLRFEATQVPAAPQEPESLGASGLLAHVQLSSLESWAELAARYEALLADRLQPTPQVRALAQEWAESAEDEPEIVRALYTQVADRIRYVGIEFGVRSYQPATPTQTLARGFGDCKDKATLLIALLRALDIPAHFVLVRTRPAGPIDDPLPSFALFDHAMVYLPGLQRFVDPTLDRNDAFTLPPGDEGAFVLVLDASPQPQIAPRAPAEAHLERWQLDLQLDQRAQAQGRLLWQLSGWPATLARRALEAEAQPALYVAEALAAFYPGATVHDLQVEGLRPAHDPVRVRGQVRLPAPQAQAEGSPWALSGAPWPILRQHTHAAQRQSPLDREHTATMDWQLTLRAPEGSALRLPSPGEPPPPIEALQLHTQLSPHRPQAPQLSWRATLQWQSALIAPEEYPALRQWLSAAEQHIQQRAWLVPAGGTP